MSAGASFSTGSVRRQKATRTHMHEIPSVHFLFSPGGSGNRIESSDGIGNGIRRSRFAQTEKAENTRPNLNATRALVESVHLQLFYWILDSRESDSECFDAVFSPNGSMIATASSNGIVRLWTTNGTIFAPV